MVDYFTKHHLPYHIILTRDKYLYQTIYARNNCDLNISLCSLQWRDNPTTTKQNRRHDSNRKMGPRCKNKMSNISTRHSHTHKSWTFLEWTKILNIKWINVFDPSQSLRRKTMEYNKISHKVTNKINLIYVVFCLIRNVVRIDYTRFYLLQVFSKENMLFLSTKDMKVRLSYTDKSVRMSLWFSINNFVIIPIPRSFLVSRSIVVESSVKNSTLVVRRSRDVILLITW